jgi:hypothetical protein
MIAVGPVVAGPGVQEHAIAVALQAAFAHTCTGFGHGEPIRVKQASECRFTELVRRRNTSTGFCLMMLSSISNARYVSM